MSLEDTFNPVPDHASALADLELILAALRERARREQGERQRTNS